MSLPDKKQIRENGIRELNEIVNILKDKRDNEAWQKCILLGVKHIGLKETQNLLSDKKLNDILLDEIENIIHLLEKNKVLQAKERQEELYKKSASAQNIHSKIIFLVHYINEFFNEQEDIKLEDIKRNFIETKESTQN